MEAGALPEQRVGLDRRRDQPGRVENAQDIISSAYLKDPTDPQWKDDTGMKDLQCLPRRNIIPKPTEDGSNVVYGYTVAQTMVQVLKQCGNDLTRANVMKQAASLKNLRARRPVARHQDQHQRHRLCALSQLQLMKLTGATWQRFGDIISAEVSD